MTIAERLPNYGVHFYEVKDKLNASWYLGISLKGIAVYEQNNKRVPFRVKYLSAVPGALTPLSPLPTDLLYSSLDIPVAPIGKPLLPRTQVLNRSARVEKVK
jgi:hypothetical protein